MLMPLGKEDPHEPYVDVLSWVDTACCWPKLFGFDSAGAGSITWKSEGFRIARTQADLLPSHYPMGWLFP